MFSVLIQSRVELNNVITFNLTIDITKNNTIYAYIRET